MTGPDVSTLTERRQRILTHLARHTATQRRPPSLRQSAAELGVSADTVRRELNALHRLGFIVRKPGKAKAVRPVVVPQHVFGLDPVVVALIEGRRDRGWTSRQFAARMGRDRETVARMERGVSVPSLALLRDAAEALGCDLAVVGGS